MSKSRVRQMVRAIVPSRYHAAVRRCAHRVDQFGTRRYCPCCGSHVRGFRPFGQPPRPEALCPVCNALERHRLLIMSLRNNRDLVRWAGRLLHVAPEAPVARHLRRLRSTQYVSLDLHATGVIVRADLTGLPFPEHAFGCVICSHVLEHVADDRRAMGELVRVLRPGGCALVQVPITRRSTFEDASIRDPDSRRRLFGQPDHVCVYGWDFKDRLAQAGFSVAVERPAERLDGEVVTRFGLRRRDEIFLCRKAR